jgi:hypothetical protein
LVAHWKNAVVTPRERSLAGGATFGSTSTPSASARSSETRSRRSSASSRGCSFEVLVFQYLPGLGRYTPGAAGSAMTGDTIGDSSIRLRSAPVGGALLGVYTVAAVLIGLAVTNRRDVT